MTSLKYMMHCLEWIKRSYETSVRQMVYMINAKRFNAAVEELKKTDVWTAFDETTKNAIGDLWMNFAWILSSNSDYKTYRNRQLIYDSICILENKVGE